MICAPHDLSQFELLVILFTCSFFRGHGLRADETIAIVFALYVAEPILKPLAIT